MEAYLLAFDTGMSPAVGAPDDVHRPQQRGCETCSARSIR